MNASYMFFMGAQLFNHSPLTYLFFNELVIKYTVENIAGHFFSCVKRGVALVKLAGVTLYLAHFCCAGAVAPPGRNGYQRMEVFLLYLLHLADLECSHYLVDHQFNGAWRHSGNNCQQPVHVHPMDRISCC